MNADIKDIKPLLIKALAWLKRHYAIIMILVVSLLYGYLILQINSFNRLEPTDTAVNEQIKQVKRPNINDQTADKLKALEDTSQEIKSLFQAARENPFQE